MSSLTIKKTKDENFNNIYFYHFSIKHGPPFSIICLYRSKKYVKHQNIYKFYYKKQWNYLYP